MRVSARPTKAEVQTSELLGSSCCLSFHRCFQHHGDISVTQTHSSTHTSVKTDSTRLFFINIFFAIKVIYHLEPLCLFLHTVLLDTFRTKVVFLYLFKCNSPHWEGVCAKDYCVCDDVIVDRETRKEKAS